MTTPTPIRELCAKATKGPYSVDYDNDTGPSDDYYREFWTVSTKDQGVAEFKQEPDAELSARLDPQTVLMVVEALETSANVGEIRFGSSALSRDAKDRIEAALRALNGQWDGGAK